MLTTHELGAHRRVCFYTTPADRLTPYTPPHETPPLAERYSLSTKFAEASAARYALWHLLGKPDDWTLERDAAGKLSSRAIAPFISISHTNEPDHLAGNDALRIISGAVTADVPCGVDVQFLVEKIMRIGHRFVVAEEAQELATLPESLLPTAYVLLWSAKEAIFKAHGRGQLPAHRNIIAFPTAAFLHNPAAELTFIGTALPHNLPPEQYHVQSGLCAENCRYAVCFREELGSEL